MIEIAIITALSVLLGIKEYLNYRERQVMLDRLMAKDFHEFKTETAPVEPDPKPEPDNLVELEEAREEILSGGREEE